MAPSREGLRSDRRPDRDRAAAEKPHRPPRQRGAEPAADSRLGSRQARGQLAIRQAAVLAATQVGELTGTDPQSVVSISRDGDEWQVEVEVVEMHRIPDSADILAIYEVDLDGQGEMVKYRRECRYLRGSTEGM